MNFSCTHAYAVMQAAKIDDRWAYWAAGFIYCQLMHPVLIEDLLEDDSILPPQYFK